MLKELASLLHRSSGRDNLGQFILVSDSLTDGGFLIHHYITQALQDGHLTYLISFAQSFIHYHSIATKLGVNLSKQEESGSFVFVDCLTHLLRDTNSFESSASPPEPEKDGEHTGSSSGSRLAFSLSRDLSLKGLYHQVIRSLKGRPAEPDRPVCLVIDDLSVLLSLGVKLSEVISFIGYCRHQLLSPYGSCSGSGCLVAMVHCDGAGGDEEEQLLRKHLLHSCHLSLHVEGLSTGYSKDVHGNLKVEWRSPGGERDKTDITGSLVKTAQYKLTDKSVLLFAKGTSSAVL